ncbi:polyprenol phosphomannose-dependent alpha 1,6 mannosyltransferase MptB [Actinomadura miaoliensis]|uniref:polyprenol phosphomannose-dependent alpha 1,6 mannosyltransferase MptB n=1 Tax=Actinomadura miaoliensis TaxID=430685 RepID=UPI0031E93A41
MTSSRPGAVAVTGPASSGAAGDRRLAGGRAGLAAVGTSLGCFLLTALLGPSAMQPELRGAAWQPPYSLTVHPSPYLVIGLVAAGVLIGTVGLALCWRAVRKGWRCRPGPLMAAGLLVVAAFTLMPPVGSADHLNYAAYGRMAVTGHDPYVTRAVDVPGDPVISEVEEWRRTPSVYGPVATATQALASWVGGDSVRLTVFVLSLFNALAFALTAWILYRTAGTAERRLRVTLLWTCNPLLLYHLVGGAHNDALAVCPMVAGLALFSARRRGRPGTVPRSLGAGALIAVGGAIKVPAALVGGGLAWALARDGRAPGARRAAALRLAALAAGALAVTAATYAIAGPHTFDQLRRAADQVSLATPWHLADLVFGRENRVFIKIGWLTLFAVLAVLLARALPRARPADGGADTGVEGERVAAALVLAWLLATPYELPWYSGFAWAALALLPWSRFDWLLLAHTAALSLGYLPARDPELIGLPSSLDFLLDVVRPGVIPVTLTVILIAAVRMCLRRPDPAPAPAPPPRAPTGSPG